MTASRSRSGPQKTLVGFELGDVHYAVDIAHVTQIVMPLPMTVLPRLPEGLVGVCEFRGLVMSVVDLRTHFGLEPKAPTRQTKWLMIGAGDHQVMLVVDGVTDVFGTPGEPLRPPPAFGVERQGILGVTSHGARMTFVIDTTRFHALAQIPHGAPALAPSPAPRLGGGSSSFAPGSKP